MKTNIAYPDLTLVQFCDTLFGPAAIRDEYSRLVAASMIRKAVGRELRFSRPRESVMCALEQAAGRRPYGGQRPAEGDITIAGNGWSITIDLGSEMSLEEPEWLVDAAGGTYLDLRLVRLEAAAVRRARHFGPARR